MVFAVRPRARQFAVLLSGLLVNAAMTVPGWSADASRWDGDQRSAVRLIAGSALGASGGRTMRGGIEVRLGPGWKMYWRYPGDAGVPPLFDFTGSENVKTITVLWPPPQRFSTDGISYLAYKDRVILPLRIVPQDAGKGVTVRMKVDYGICETLCILAEAKAELLLSGFASAHEVALTAAESRVPKRVEIGQGKTLTIRSIEREAGTIPPRVIVNVAAAKGSRVDLFVEGPTPDWALPLPERIEMPDGASRFAFELAGAPPGAKPEDAILKFTAVADGEAIEVLTPLR